MGGNLLKTWGLPEKRLSASDYEKLKHDLLVKLAEDTYCHYPYPLNVAVASALRNKESHGDLDILFGSYGPDSMEWKGEKDFYKYAEKEWGVKPHRNSNVISFPVDGFQVDVTFIPYNDFPSAIAYTSWGDLGNLMGRIFHKMGLHYGHLGLQFWIRQGMFDKNIAWSDSDHIYEKCTLSRDTKEIFEIGGFDYERWLLGFDTEEQAFDFVTSSKYFDSSLFELENLNHTNRTRNRKRGMYMRFIEYLKDKTFEGKEKILDKDTYSILYQLRFPYLAQQVAKYRLFHDMQKVIKAKFNGKLVCEWVGTEDGPTIGKLVRAVKEQYTNEMLLVTDQAKIQQFVLETFKAMQ